MRVMWNEPRKSVGKKSASRKACLTPDMLCLPTTLRLLTSVSQVRTCMRPCSHLVEVGVGETLPLGEQGLHAVDGAHALRVQLALAVHVHDVEADGGERRTTYRR